MPDSIPKLLVGERLAIAVLALGAAGCALLEMKGPGADLAMTGRGMMPWAECSVLLLGISLALWKWRPDGWRQRIIAGGVAGLVIMGTAFLGFQAAPVTAGSLLVLSIALLLLVLPAARRMALGVWGLVLSALPGLMHVISLQGRALGIPLLPDDGAADLSWLMSAALILLSFALVLAFRARYWLSRLMLGKEPERGNLVPVLERSWRNRMLALFILAAILLVAAGYVYVGQHLARMRIEITKNLTDVSALQVERIEAWRRERMANVLTLSRAPIMADFLTRQPDAKSPPAALQRYLEENCRAYGYRSAVITDRTGAARLTVTNGAAGPVETDTGLVQESILTGKVVIDDLRLTAGDAITMSFIAPVFAAGQESPGAVVLTVDASQKLFPMLARWPTASRTSETQLVRREGLTGVFLADPRFHPGVALKRRFALGEAALPAARAALERRVELSEGVGYRGVPLLWRSMPVGDSPWVLVAKIDQAEAFAPLQAEVWRSGITFLLGLIGVGLLVSKYWLQRRREYVLQQLETEQERRAAVERLALVMRHANDVIFLFDEDMRIVEANERALAVYGRTPQEMRQLKAQDLHPEQAKGMVGRNFAQALTAEGLTFETEHRRKDGTVFPVEVSSRGVEIEGRRLVLSIVRDITERRRLMEELVRQEARFRFIFEHAPVGISLVLGNGEVMVNEAHALITGVPVEDSSIPGIFARASHPEDYARQTAASQAYAHNEVDSYAVEKRYLHPDGRTVWARLSSHWFLDPASGRKQSLTIIGDISEQKRQEEALRIREATFRRLLTMVPLPIAHSDRDGRITFVNERFQQVFGYTPDEVPTVQAWWTRAYPDPQYREALQTKWAQAVQLAAAGGGDIDSMETSVTCKDGQVRNVQVSGMMLGEEVLVAFVDVTERVRTEQKLRQLSRTIEQAPLSVMITDLSGAIEYVNPRFCEVSGFTAEEVLGRNPRVLKSGGTPPETYADMWRTLDRGEVWRGELCNRKKNGELYYEQAVIAPVAEDNGVITHYVALKEDITEHRRNEAVLRETQEQYRIIAENTSDTIWLYDLATERFTYCSPSILKLRGYTVEEILGQKMADSLTPESAAYVARAMPDRLARYAAGDLSILTEVHELDQVCRDGSVIATEVSTTLLGDATGRPTQILGVTRDVTKRRRAEKALNESRDRLAKAEQIARLGNWTLEIATNQVTWSDEMYRLLELDPATNTPSIELYQSFMSPEDRNVLDRRFAEALTKPQRFVLGTRLILRDSRIKYVEGTGEVLCTPEGTPVRAIGTVQDVTERKLVEMELHELVKGLRVLRTISQALQQREQSRDELLALVVQELPSAMVFPADARALIEIDGLRQEAGTGGELLARLMAPITINDRAAGAVTVGYVRPHPAADEGPFRVREREILDSIARTIGLGLGERESFAAVQRFNTELEGKVDARTTELAARNQQIEALLSSIPDTVMRLRTDGSILFSQRAQGSPRLADITPQPAERPGSPATADLLAACLRLGRQGLVENFTGSGEIEIGTPGGPVAIELRSAPISTEEFVIFVRDITARKRLEAELATMLEKEREISEMKTRFISVTSHEFRTPMAAAMGSVELLHNHFDRLTPTKREELFVRVYGSMHRMTEMLDDILTLNRMDANRLEVQLCVIDLRNFVQSAIDEIRLGDRDAHRFELAGEGETAEFVSDTSLLHHILSNLLSNAVRYSPAGTVVTTGIAAEANRVRITVTDQGIGIPEADRQRIFEPFERGSNVGLIKGTGLGLNIVQRMSGLLGGTVSVGPVAGGGSCFTLTFPRLPAPASSP